ncbi:hypothetical protein CD128_11310, partial [Staphylococcus croceilyticus]
MTVNYDKRTLPSDLTTRYSLPNIVDDSGEVIANGSYDLDNRQLTYTFTDYVDKYENIVARLSLTSYIDKEQVPDRDTNLDLTYKTANTEAHKDVTIEYQYPQEEGPANISTSFTRLDEDNQRIEQTIYVNPLRENIPNPSLVVSGQPTNNSNGSTIIDNDTYIRIYKVRNDQTLPDSNKIYDYSQYEDVTNSEDFTITRQPYNNQFKIDFGQNIDTPYIVQVVSSYGVDDDGYSQVQQHAILSSYDSNSGGTYNAGYGNNVEFSSNNSGGSGDTPAKKYKIGDYVWEDVDKDGIQGTDNNERPISGVLVTLTNPDGTQKSVRTDENGHYEFDGLDDGSTYTVSFETPDGYTPTVKNAANSTNENDSNGSSVTVTIQGHDDMTLDSGFYKTPKYKLGDYVWYDTNKDGHQDDNEKGIKGVTVTLKDNNGNVLKTTQTDENGKYIFEDLDSGEYNVHFDKPDGLTQTTTDSGDDEKDADGEDVHVTITDHDDLTIDNGYFEEDSDSDS